MNRLKRYIIIPVVAATVTVGALVYRNFSESDVPPIVEAPLIQQNYCSPLDKELADLEARIVNLEIEQKKMREVYSIMFEMGALERAYRFLEESKQ